MGTVTIRAADSTLALEEVMRCLGPDALIVSTRQHMGQVEIIAAPAGGTAPLPSAPQPPEPRANGFAGQLLRQLARAPLHSGVLPPQLPGRVVLAGPPGGGRSTLALRLAAEALRSPGAARPVLVAPRPDLLTAPGRLSAQARLLGLVPHRPVWSPDGPFPLESPAMDTTQIVDLSDMPPLDPARLGEIAARSDAALWLVLPTGLHPAQIDRLCAPFAGLASHVVMTRTDLCPPTEDDLDPALRHGLPLSLLAGGAGLLDALTALAAPVTDTPASERPDWPGSALNSEELPDAAARLS
ncbi:hypothetical protein [Pseudotabrizicola algicola]|uniref:Flagellar biosynthesis protein FlhF n=1 Tax=Pseudotabrizicola algicola TaxID=2709381 RepID=A0A6B3RQ67_9RHOB|nr:hypothetical protein [Pseudotabrizicola algicola]NEX45259.1 hypothetical protein [Pseudotabrizicola algicola]